LSTFKFHPCYVQLLADHSSRLFKLNRLPYPTSRKQPCGSHHLPSSRKSIRFFFI
jgi:hypothetical protein